MEKNEKKTVFVCCQSCCYGV